MAQLMSKNRTLPLRAALISIILLILAGCSAIPAQPAATPTAFLLATPEIQQETGGQPSPEARPTLQYMPPDPALLGVTYICNDGFIITRAGKKILVDALYQRNIRLCLSDLPELMASSQPPFDNVDLVLVTHNHPDHFQAQVVGQYLMDNPKAILVAEKSAADTLLGFSPTYDVLRDRIHSIELTGGKNTSISINGIDLGIFDAPGDVPNLGFLIKVGGKTLFHGGDHDLSPGTKAILNSYGFPEMNIDVAFVNYFLMIDPVYREEMMKIMVAEKYILMHYAEESNPEYILNTLRILAAGDIVFEQSLQTWTK